MLGTWTFELNRSTSPSATHIESPAAVVYRRCPALSPSRATTAENRYESMSGATFPWPRYAV